MCVLSVGRSAVSRLRVLLYYYYYYYYIRVLIGRDRDRARVLSVRVVLRRVFLHYCRAPPGVSSLLHEGSRCRF